VNFDLGNCYVSSLNIRKIAELCPRVERLAFLSPNPSDLKRSDIEALASLPRLKNLNIYRDENPSDVISSLSSLKVLKCLGICWSDDVADVLPLIGPNLVSLELRETVAEAWQVVRDFPNLKYLQMRDHELCDDTLQSLNGGVKKRLKNLASFKIDEAAVRLGTDWAGYSTDSDEETEEGGDNSDESESREGQATSLSILHRGRDKRFPIARGRIS